ncbi:hypothetical protein OG264_20530 [Streptomyces xanthophaeus]|uniref:hypothetical protein n=1 Tax=Streptomyces xanthophaeus TaxID=67385 RepID=UPI003863605D|nr:hypothetical protein OG264_20530 [Streptomyces xanthophaeus]WST61341.1 hypothetical protein OG605_17910 [Streptomyces xanthophaeus]
MPAEVLRDPLALKLSLPGEPATVIVIGDLPNPRLAADLTEGLAASVHPEGPLAKLTTVKSFTYNLRRMVRELAEDGFTGSAAELTRAVLGAFWLRSHYLVEYRTRTILRAFDARHRVLPEAVRQMVFGTNYKRPTLNGPLPPYAPAEWNRLVDLCKEEVRRLGNGQRARVALAEKGQDPAVGGWSRANGAWLMLRLGPVTRTEIAAHLGITPDVFTKCHRGIEGVRSGLFPSHRDAIPFMLLLAAWTGIVPDGLAGLEVSGIRWAGRQATLLSYTKGRTADESLVLSPRASRLLEQWLQHSALLREHAPAELAGHVWLVTRQGRCSRAAFEEYMMRGWVKAHDLRGDDGHPLRIDRRRMRTTFIAQRGQRQWSLRATIDPNHSPEVEGDHYLSAATPAQKAVEDIARDAQGDLLRRASAPLVIDEAASAAALPEEVLRLGLTQGALGELLSGERDVFSGACADQFAGLHGPKGKPCPARPWVCLLCPLALFAPRHLPNLLRLKAFFARQFRQMPREQFATVFAPYARRLSADVLPRFEKAAIAAAQRDVGDEDAELPLRPEETTS